VPYNFHSLRHAAASLMIEQGFSPKKVQEESGYYSGLVGYDRLATKIVFGSFWLVEKCAADGASPIDTDYRKFLGSARLR
jgi:hypothetical protein